MTNGATRGRVLAAAARASVLALALALGLALPLAACAAKAEVLVPVSYEKTAKLNYDKALLALNKGNTFEAQKLFTYVRTKFPYSELAVYAELRLADTAMARGAYGEAIDGYNLFIKLHPTHLEAPYATYRIWLAVDQQIPSDLFITPPSY